MILVSRQFTCPKFQCSFTHRSLHRSINHTYLGYSSFVPAKDPQCTVMMIYVTPQASMHGHNKRRCTPATVLLARIPPPSQSVPSCSGDY